MVGDNQLKEANIHVTCRLCLRLVSNSTLKQKQISSSAFQISKPSWFYLCSLQRFWEIDEVSVNKHQRWKKEDAKTHFILTTPSSPERWFIEKLPFKEIGELGVSQQLARRKLVLKSVF